MCQNDTEKTCTFDGISFKKSYQKTNPDKKVSFLKFTKNLDISSGLVSKACVFETVDVSHF